MLVRPEEQRAKADALVAFRPADDHELLALDALDLEPVARAGAPIWSARFLRDDALSAHLADFVKHVLAAADYMVTVEDRRRHALEQRCQALLALDVREPSDVLAAIDQKIKGVED